MNGVASQQLCGGYGWTEPNLIIFGLKLGLAGFGCHIVVSVNGVQETVKITEEVIC